MLKYQGKSVSRGIAMGRILVLNRQTGVAGAVHVTDAEMECARVQAAIEEGKAQLGLLYEKACAEVGENGAAIFEAHQMLMEDKGFRDAIYNIIRREQVSAEYAVTFTGDNFAEMFETMDDEYFRARAADIKDVAGRLVRILAGEDTCATDSCEPVIIAAQELSPSEIAAMDKTKILGFVTIGGSVQSHAAILAGMMNIPAIIGIEGLDLNALKNGMTVIADGNSGVFTYAPTPEECGRAADLISKEEENRALLVSMKGKENVTKSGRRIDIYANIGSVDDCGYVLENDADGVGLFRSEFLYLGRDSFPTEEEQFNAYRSVAGMLGERPVIIRTLDLGADKRVGYFNLDEEENPALGYRAIRICLTQTNIFRTQLRALLRASIFGNIKIMYPMITSVWEVQEIKKLVTKAAKELDEEGIAYRIPEQGIMIETPAAVIMADELAKEVDFFSVGTNDLIQYTLAVDRQNNKLGRFFDSHHPAVLRMLDMIIKAAHGNGIRVGICGELGADPELLPQFLDMGLDEISVVPSSVLKLRKLVRELE